MNPDTPPPPAPLPPSRKLIVALTLISMVAGILVVLTYQLTLPRITENRQKALEKAVFSVLSGATVRTNYLLDASGLNALPDEDFSKANVFAGYDESGVLVGLAMQGSARGYQDVVKILYGYSPEKECVVGVTVLQSTETPGLGDRVETDPDFLANFECLDATLNPERSALANDIVTVKNGKKTQAWQIDGISGATITSAAIGTALRKSTNTMLPLLAKHKASLAMKIEK